MAAGSIVPGMLGQAGPAISPIAKINRRKQLDPLAGQPGETVNLRALLALQLPIVAIAPKAGCILAVGTGGPGVHLPGMKIFYGFWLHGGAGER